MSLALAPYVAAHEIRESRRDPLARFVYRNPVQRTLVENVHRAQIYLHAANMSGKTTVGCALDVALCRGLHKLGGVRLPRLELPVHGALIVGSYKQSVGSSIAAIRQWVGEHPCEEAMVQASMDYVGIFYIRPDGWRSNDWKTWSRIYVFTHDGELPEGLRLDFVHADEIPPPAVLYACRFRGKAGKPFLLYITGTPIYEKEWGYLMTDKEFLHCLNQVKDGKLRLQSSLFDNDALSEEDRERAQRAAASDPHGRARLWGEHIDVSGSCPFDPEALHRLMMRVKAPERLSVVVRTKHPERVSLDTPEIPLPISVFGPADERDSYYLTADLASGIRAPSHDPLAVHVWARSARRLVVTYNGFVHPFGLGQLAAELARRYTTPVGPCLVDPERNGGYFDQFMEGLYAGGYYSVAHDSRPGVAAQKIGYDQSKATRDNIVAAWVKALQNDDIVMESEEVLSCLSNCIDDGGTVIARHGYHDEHLICGGRALHVIDTRGERRAPRPPPLDERAAFARMLRDMFGRPVIRSLAGLGGPPDRWSPPAI